MGCGGPWLVAQVPRRTNSIPWGHRATNWSLVASFQWMNVRFRPRRRARGGLNIPKLRPVGSSSATGHPTAPKTLTGIRPVTVVPRLGAERTSNVPPCAARRSAIPCRPVP